MNATSASPSNREGPTTSLSIEPLCVDDHPAFAGHEEVLRCRDAASGLEALIAIHSTRLGPALGGCRMWAYADRREALTDVLRLSQAMSAKHAVAQIARGGGKAVILGDPQRDKTDQALRAFGRFVERGAGGRYITAEDVGISVEDMELVRRETSHVAGLPLRLGGSGDPSPSTAYGVFCGIKAAVAFPRGTDWRDERLLRGRTVAVQGLGHVGFSLCEHLAAAGARLIVTDIDAASVLRVCEQFGADPVEPRAIYDAEADVFAPCALGAVLTRQTVRRLRAKVVAGAANNQLADDEAAELLRERGVLYAPDYVINAGGVINISCEDGGPYDAQRARSLTSRIGDRLTEIFRRAAVENKTTAQVADEIAQTTLARGL